MILFLIATPSATLAGPQQSDVKGDATSKDTVANTGLKVTWQDIIKLVDTHPQIGASQDEIAASRAAVDAAGAVPNPSLEAATAYGKAIDNSASKMEWGLGLSIPLGWIAKRSARIEAANAEVQAMDAEAKVLRLEVLLQLRVLFWTLVYEQERVAVLGELNNQIAALTTTVMRRVEKGEVRPVEATRVEVEAEMVASELEVAGLTLKARRLELATWLGIPKDKQLTAVADLNQLPEPITQERAIKTALQHSRMDAAKARIQMLAANTTVERKERVPSFDFEIFTDHELDRSAYGVGLAIELPLWNWNTGNIQRSEHMLSAEKNKLKAEGLEIETLAIEAQSKCEAGVTLATHYRNRILPRAESAAQIIERTYELGEATLLDVIDARRTLLDTKRQFLDTLAQAQIDCSRLNALIGENLP